jgi:thioredoxin 1
MENVNTQKLTELQEQGNKILVDLFGVWCGPCKQLVPRLEGIEKEYPNVTFIKIDVDENRDLATSLGITGVPTVLMFDGKELKHRSSGINTDKFYKDLLNSL